MNATRHIAIDEFDYLLPDERIAKFPLEQRSASKLMVYRNGEISESRFGSLPEQYRDLFVMRFLEDYSYEEIAEITGLSKTNVSVKLMRAKNKIKEMFNA